MLLTLIKVFLGQLTILSITWKLYLSSFVCVKSKHTCTTLILLTCTQARRMVDYLKGVKINNMIIMAIRDSTWPRHWKQKWIKYVNGYGAKTVQLRNFLRYNPHPASSARCPFTARKFHSWYERANWGCKIN